MRVVTNAIVEVLEDVVEHFLVLGVDSEARHGRRAAVIDGALFHNKWLSDSRDDTESAATTIRRSGHRVSRPHHRRELDSVATHVPDRLCDRQTTQAQL